MNNCFRSLHVITSIFFNMMLLIITFTTDNPVLLLAILICSILVLSYSCNIGRFINGLIVFIPFFVITASINIFFAQQGRIILFSIGSRHFTLEAMLYSVILSFKLLLVVYIFQMLGIMMDSDRAVGYFSSLLPKSTLTFMIALKLFPIMKKRIAALRETYSIRGVDFEGRSIWHKLAAYKPVLSVLLEDSLEKSFDIGEAVFVRGFLSSKRTVYDRQKLNSFDWILAGTSLLTLLIFLSSAVFGLMVYDIYNAKQITDLFNKGVLLVMTSFVFLFGELTFMWKRLVVKDELY